tara:strand:- start:10813 stop:12132 length:1320 start_codon:yes stop_codon:yes gene_type:complete
MPVPASGPLQLRGDIALEVNGSATGTDVSLGALSNTAGFTEPDAMSDFYDFSMVSAPTVQTDAASSVTASSFTANGNATNDNGASITDRGFYIGTDSNYANNTKTSVGGSGTGTFLLAKTGLVFNTTYYITAYATNSEGEGRGATITQNTSNASPPTITTEAITSVSYTSMTGNADLTADGGATVTQRGFYYGTSSSYASNTKLNLGGGVVNPFSYSFGSLSTNTTYYVTAYAINAAGESVGATVNAQTLTPASYNFINSNTRYFSGPDKESYSHCIGNSSTSASGSFNWQYNHASYGWTNISSASRSLSGTKCGQSDPGTVTVYIKGAKRTDATNRTDLRALMSQSINSHWTPYYRICGITQDMPALSTSGCNPGSTGTSGHTNSSCSWRARYGGIYTSCWAAADGGGFYGAYFIEFTDTTPNPGHSSSFNKYILTYC